MSINHECPGERESEPIEVIGDLVNIVGLGKDADSIRIARKMSTESAEFKSLMRLKPSNLLGMLSTPFSTVSSAYNVWGISKELRSAGDSDNGWGERTASAFSAVLSVGGILNPILSATAGVKSVLESMIEFHYNGAMLECFDDNIIAIDNRYEYHISEIDKRIVV